MLPGCRADIEFRLTTASPDDDFDAHVARPTDKAAVAIPTDVLNDPQLAARRSSAGGGDDQAEFLGKCCSALAARASEKSHRGELSKTMSSIGAEPCVFMCSQGENELKSLKRLEPGPKTDALKKFYDLSQRIVEHNTAVVEGVLAHPSTAKILSSGRVVILTDGVRAAFPFALLILADPFLSSISEIILPSYSSRHHWLFCRPASSTPLSSSTCSLLSTPIFERGKTVGKVHQNLVPATESSPQSCRRRR